MFSLNAHNFKCVLDDFSHVSIVEIMTTGTIGMTGMFMGQSISTSTSTCHR